MTSMSGFAATTASAVARMRVRIVGKPRDHGREAHDGDIFEREQARRALPAAIAWPADAAEAHALRSGRALSARISLAPSWSPDSSPATIQIVSGRPQPWLALHPRQFDRDEEQPEAIGRPRASRPARARGWSPPPRRLPDRPARAASATVRGPMAGMSTRRSCPRLAALISTPPSRRRCGGRARIGACAATRRASGRFPPALRSPAHARARRWRPVRCRKRTGSASRSSPNAMIGPVVLGAGCARPGRTVAQRGRARAHARRRP